MWRNCHAKKYMWLFPFSLCFSGAFVLNVSFAFLASLTLFIGNVHKNKKEVFVGINNNFYLCCVKRPIEYFLLLLLAVVPMSLVAQTEKDTLSLSVPMQGETMRPLPITLIAPTYWGVAPLTLHQGLNAEVGLGVRVGFGKRNPWKGASFFTTLTALYAMPLSKDGRWTAAVGGYYDNYRLWNSRVNQLGLMGLVDYRLNERLNLSAFLMHDFGLEDGMFSARSSSAPSLLCMNPCYPYMALGMPVTTIGANLGIKLSETAAISIGISVSRQQNPIRYEHIPNNPAFNGPVDRVPAIGGTRMAGGL